MAKTEVIMGSDHNTLREEAEKIFFQSTVVVSRDNQRIYVDTARMVFMKEVEQMKSLGYILSHFYPYSNGENEMAIVFKRRADI